MKRWSALFLPCTCTAAFFSHARLSPARISMLLPIDVAEALPSAVRDLDSTEENWKALRECYPSEEAALEAVRKNIAVVVPYGYEGYRTDGAENIRGSFRVLQDLLDDEAEVLQIITKNPGVLGCKPAELAKSNAVDVRRAASVVSTAEFLLSPTRRFLQSLPGWDEGTTDFLTVAQQKADLEMERADNEILLEQLELDGEPFLYDPSGEYMGVEHLLLRDDGTPVGTWDPVKEEMTECDFTGCFDDNEE